MHNNPGATVRIFPSGLVEAIKYTGYQIVLNSTNYPGSTEFIMFNRPPSLMQFNAGGTIALQRNFNIQGHELRFIGSPTTISKSVVVQLSGANYASTNCTIDENIEILKKEYILGKPFVVFYYKESPIEHWLNSPPSKLLIFMKAIAIPLIVLIIGNVPLLFMDFLITHSPNI